MLQELPKPSALNCAVVEGDFLAVQTCLSAQGSKLLVEQRHQASPRFDQSYDCLVTSFHLQFQYQHSYYYIMVPHRERLL